MEFIKPDVNIAFSKFWYKAAAVSAVLVVLSVILVFYRMFISQNFNWGTDFAGGTEMQILFQDDVNLSAIRESVADAGLASASVTRFGGDDSRQVLVRVRQTEDGGGAVAKTVMNALESAFGAEKVSMERLDEVGPKVGRDLKINGVISLVLAMGGIFIYVWFRFTNDFAPGALVALLHDLFVSLGCFVLFNLEFELSTLAALLTIVGYSINDTLVIYDRIREKLKSSRVGDFQAVVEKSLNETLSRTILTSLLTFFVVLALFFFSQGEIRDFAFILMVGIIAGSYSTIFVATPLLVWFNERSRAAAA